MKKIISFFAIIIVIASCNRPDKAEQVKRLKIQSDSICQALTVMNTKLILNYSYPAFINVMGGAEKMAKGLSEGRRVSESHLIFVKSIKPQEPSAIIEVEDELQAIVPIVIESSNAKSAFTEKSTLIAISKDHGNNWLFINTFGRKLSDLKQDYKNLSTNLTLIRK
jgi:site-specific recombinase XerD